MAIRQAIMMNATFLIVSNYLFYFTYLNARGADIRHTLHGSPQTTTIYGKPAPIRDSFYNSCCSFVCSGDCEATEQYVLENVQVRNPFAKIVIFYDNSIKNERK
jgi:hypothetical protein